MGSDDQPAGLSDTGRRLMEGMDALQGVAAAVGGYRTRLIDAGFSPHVAEQMALQLHETLMTQMANATAKPAAGWPRRKG